MAAPRAELHGERAVRAAGAPAPLVAVCGLVGGAGTTTLAHLLALWATRRSERCVLVCDTGGPAAALAAYAGRSSRLPLALASEAIARGQAPPGLFASIGERLRMIAASPDEFEDFDPGGLALLFEQARSAHELTVVDCGTLQRPVDRAAAGLATRVVWVTRATPAGAARARSSLAARAGLAADAELLAARRGPGARRDATRLLIGLAEERGAPLVLVPELADDPTGAEGLERLRVPLEAIGSAVR